MSKKIFINYHKTIIIIKSIECPKIIRHDFQTTNLDKNIIWDKILNLMFKQGREQTINCTSEKNHIQ